MFPTANISKNIFLCASFGVAEKANSFGGKEK
jgi:hypothetical protein